MSQTDYTTIALITIFTSLCTSIGKEVGEEFVKWLKTKLKSLRCQAAKQSLTPKS
jgi:hypothetical protein